MAPNVRGPLFECQASVCMNAFFTDLGHRYANAAASRGAVIPPPVLDPEVAAQLLELAGVVAHTQEEINHLYQQCEDDNDWFFLSFMLGTGLREGEAMHAETSDLVGTTLLVQRKNKFDWRPKKCHVRKVEITPALAAAIKSRPQGLLFRNTQCNPDGHLLRRLQRLAKGGGFVPVHCASYCFLNSPKYIELVGAQFQTHGTGVFKETIVKPDHPVMKALSEIDTVRLRSFLGDGASEGLETAALVVGAETLMSPSAAAKLVVASMNMMMLVTMSR